MDTVSGGRFLNAYRKLSHKFKFLDGVGDESPLEHECTLTQFHSDHSFSYVLGNDPEVSFEIAAALSQFEPVTVCIQDNWEHAKKSLPDHIRVIQLSNMPSLWSDSNPVLFVKTVLGEDRIVELVEDIGSSIDTPIRRIAEIERIYYYRGPPLEVKKKSISNVLESNDGRLVFQCDVNSDIRKYVGGIKSMSHATQWCRIVSCSEIIVSNLSTKEDLDRLDFNQIHKMDNKYLGYFLTNRGILLVAYEGDSENAESNLKALKLLQGVYPNRRIVQIQSSARFLNINDYVMGFYGARNALPESTFTKIKATRTHLNTSLHSQVPRSVNPSIDMVDMATSARVFNDLDEFQKDISHVNEFQESHEEKVSFQFEPNVADSEENLSHEEESYTFQVPEVPKKSFFPSKFKKVKSDG